MCCYVHRRSSGSARTATLGVQHMSLQPATSSSCTAQSQNACAPLQGLADVVVPVQMTAGRQDLKLQTASSGGSKSCPLKPSWQGLLDRTAAAPRADSQSTLHLCLVSSPSHAECVQGRTHTPEGQLMQRRDAQHTLRHAGRLSWTPQRGPPER